jgi:hypothetical protein
VSSAPARRRRAIDGRGSCGKHRCSPSLSPLQRALNVTIGSSPLQPAPPVRAAGQASSTVVRTMEEAASSEAPVREPAIDRGVVEEAAGGVPTATLSAGRELNTDMVTERLHYFHTGTSGQKYSFGGRVRSFADDALDDPCPASMEQRVSACTDVFEVWNDEARRRRVSAGVNYSARGSHDPRRRSLSSGLSSFSCTSSREGSTSGRERAGSDSCSRSSSASGRGGSTLVIRITPSNSCASLSDLPGVHVHPSGEDGVNSSPSSGCIGATDESDQGRTHLPTSLASSSTISSAACESRGSSEFVDDGNELHSAPPSEAGTAPSPPDAASLLAARQQRQGTLRLCRKLLSDVKAACRRRRRASRGQA